MGQKVTWFSECILTPEIDNVVHNIYVFCVVNCCDNVFIAKHRNRRTSLDYKKNDISYVAANESEKVSQVAPILY